MVRETDRESVGAPEMDSAMALETDLAMALETDLVMAPETARARIRPEDPQATPCT